jgi:heme exporter protein A
VVGVHRARTHADPLDVDAVGALDDRLDRRQVGRVGWADHRALPRVCHAWNLTRVLQKGALGTANAALSENRRVSRVIELEGVRRDYGERIALREVTVELETGETMVVLGPNGAGKTTLLRILATLLRPTAGAARVLGCELPGEAWKLRGRIGYLGHEPLLYRDLSGRENLAFQARLHGIAAEDAERRIAELLEAVAMERRADERIAELSAGMRQRLAICRCALHRPELLLLDEPDSNLDAESRELAQALIGPGAGRTRVLVTHDPERYAGEADTVLQLAIGAEVLA